MQNMVRVVAHVVKQTLICFVHHRLLGSSSGCSLPLQSRESSASNAPHIKQLSSTESSVGAHHHQSQQVQQSSNSYTSLDDKQEDASSNTMAADNNDNDHNRKQRGPAIKHDDQRELPISAYAPLIIGKHADASELSRTMALPVRPETDKKERRYSDNHRLSAQQSYVIVPSTWFDNAVQRECRPADFNQRYVDQRKSSCIIIRPHIVVCSQQSAYQDSRQLSLTVSRQVTNDQQEVSTN